MASSTPAARVHVQSPQTAVPTRAVEPGRARPIAVASPPLPAAAMQRRTRVVLCYRADAGVGADGGGAARGLWEEAVWAKESLSEAVADHPEMAGRLRRRSDGSSWEVKLNDAGVRFVQAAADATVEEVVAAEGEDRARWDAALAPWVDVNAEEPDMCALFYLQLTRFHGDGGYAVGVSCSLLLADPLSLARFLTSWARTHAKMKAQSELATNPLMQYAGYFQRPGAMAARPRTSSVRVASVAGETVLFRARATAGQPGAPRGHRALAGACVAQLMASERLSEVRVPPRFSVVVVVVAADEGATGGISVETCAADGEPLRGGGGECELEAAQWQELGLDELVLGDSKPVHGSYSIVVNGGDEGLVVVMPDGAAGEFLVAATVPKY
ncbi:hypothetical protein ACP70R_000780 [Stipagrostis hirtigluma subsp. patula]